MKNKNPREKITVRMDALDFIGKLVNHIHPKGFRVVRRYGLYSRRKNKLSIEIVKLYNFMKQRNIFELIQKQKNKKRSFKERLIETFGVNPFICTSCGNEIDQFKPRRIVDTDESDQMPELVCPNCR